MKSRIREYNRKWSGAAPSEIISSAAMEFGEKIVFASSMGAEDQVITSIIAEVAPGIRIFTLDTGRLFQETYDLISITSSRYNVPIHICFPDAYDVEEMINTKGPNLFYESVENRKLCCNIRKIEPMKRALIGTDAWISGLRRSQSVTRHDLDVVEWDETFSRIKINPLINWTEKELWDYIREHKIPYNTLHDKGYPSIGCLPCTRAVQPGEEVRAGRWWWENPTNKECGLHQPVKKNESL